MIRDYTFRLLHRNQFNFKITMYSNNNTDKVKKSILLVLWEWCVNCRIFTVWLKNVTTIIKLRECFTSPFKLLCLLQMSSWKGGWADRGQGVEQRYSTGLQRVNLYKGTLRTALNSQNKEYCLVNLFWMYMVTLYNSIYIQNTQAP